MDKYIASKQLKEYLKEINHEFTDYEKAIIIWNSLLVSMSEKIHDLKEIVNNTAETELKKQIDTIININDSKLLNSFVNIPYPDYFEKGIIVKNYITNEYGVIATSVDEWNKSLMKINSEKDFDYYDMAITVYNLNSNGEWSHSHVNPIYLDVEYPHEYDLHTRALDAMSGYLSHGENSNEKQKVIEASKDYALSIGIK